MRSDAEKLGSLVSDLSTRIRTSSNSIRFWQEAFKLNPISAFAASASAVNCAPTPSVDGGRHCQAARALVHSCPSAGTEVARRALCSGFRLGSALGAVSLSACRI